MMRSITKRLTWRLRGYAACVATGWGRGVLMLLALLISLAATAQKQHGDGIDDLLQHAPMAAVFVLKGCEMDNDTSWGELALTAASAYTLTAAVAYSAKQVVGERRPDKSDNRSFPSGHTAFAFAGATVLSHEFGHLSPWVSIGGYGVATLTAVDRVARDRHYLHDVCAGAAIGFGMTELTYYLKERLIKSKNIDLGFTGQTFDLTVRF